MEKTYIFNGKWYQCIVCGAVGNWKAKITTGKCHLQRKKGLSHKIKK